MCGCGCVCGGSAQGEAEKTRRLAHAPPRPRRHYPPTFHFSSSRLSHPTQVAAWEPTLQKIAGWFDQLQAVDVEGVPPATDAGVGGASTRPDVVDTSLADADVALGQVPEREGDFVRVPKVM